MKLEDLLMQPREDKQTVLQLQKQVEGLEEELDEEIQVKRVLKCAIKGPFGCCRSCSSLSPLLPFKVQMLLGEVAAVEEEIDWLERKITELSLDIYQHKKHIKEWQIIQLKGLLPQSDHRHLRKLPSRRPSQIEQNNCRTLLSTSHSNERRRYRISRQRRASFGSSIELNNGVENEEEIGKSRWSESKVVEPNKISVELIKCLIGIFVKLNNQTSFANKGTTNNNGVTKDTRISKTTFSCTMPVFTFNHNASSSHIDPYDILPEPGTLNIIRDVGPYKNFIEITKSTLDPIRLSECLPSMRRLRVLMQKLSKININCLTHKQKLAFWINVYNASIMNAFLKQGLPSTLEKKLALVNKAAINVGGFIFKASTIEHLILRHPVEAKQEIISIEEKEMLVRRNACGLDYPEPNVVFALCQGSCSSPALRYYTADEVMNELERAKVEYLEASVGITTRKTILVPKLMQCHMKDFADDMESLVEWIYSQLPYTSSLKRLMIECLNGGDITNYESQSSSSSSQKRIEIQPYASEFRYLIPI